MTTINLVIMIIYHIISAFVAFVLIWSIIKTKDVQEAILYCIILIPFTLRVFHIK
ncbi:hypothetical protein ES705_04188 [subsurface metagenome]|jgi:hypothetical protein|uniref:Uncharacterized protein n=1 Tax=marine sediment metagenome TaxID=412755 RepID=X1THI5_9ZZZZ